MASPKVTVDNFWAKAESGSAPNIEKKEKFLLDPANDISDIVAKLSDDPSSDLETIARMLLKHDYKVSFSDRMDLLLDKLRVEGKINNLLDAFETIFSSNLKNAFNNNKEQKEKGDILKSVLLHMPNLSQVERFTKVCENLDSKIVKEMFMQLDLTNPIERQYAKNVLGANGFSNVIIEYFQNNITEATNADKVAEMDKLVEIGKDFGAAKTEIVAKILNGKDETQLNVLFEALSNVTTDAMNPLGNRKYLAVLPRELKTRYTDYLIKNNKLNFNTITSLDEKAEILENASPEERKKVVATLSEDEKDAIEKHMSSKLGDAKPTFKNTAKRVDKISSEMEKIQGGEKGVGLKAQIKAGEKSIKATKKDIKKLKKKIAKDEKRLIMMAGFPEALDRIGFIENIHLRHFMEANKQYKDHLAELSAAEKELAKTEKDVEKLSGALEESKERIRAQRDAMRRELDSFKERRKTIRDPERIKELLGREMPSKVDKVGKTTDNAKLQQAWAYLVQAHKAGARYQDMDVSSIITANKESLGLLEDEELKALIARVQQELKAKSYASLSDEELDETIQESAGMHMGMSNYALIITATALVVTGMIIILTMILS